MIIIYLSPYLCPGPEYFDEFTLLLHEQFIRGGQNPYTCEFLYFSFNDKVLGLLAFLVDIVLKP